MTDCSTYSKLTSLTGGKRVNNVEDVLTLGQSVEVRVDDIDPQGKVSLSLAAEVDAATNEGGDDGAERSTVPAARAGGSSSSGTSFEDAFEAELVADLGDLGPGAAEDGGGRGDRGGDRGDRRSGRRRTRRR